MRFEFHPAASLFCLALASVPAHADWESAILPRNFDMANSLQGAIALAREKKKAVIVYYTRTACPPCTALQARLRKEEVAAPFKAGYVFTAVWGSAMGHTERETYRNRYGVQGAPTWLVFNANGDYVCTSGGGFDTDASAKTLHEAIQLRLSAAAPSSDTGPRRCRGAK